MATAVLLGAGASTDAGIPKSVDLTREIYEYLSQQGDDGKRQARALGTVIAGLSYRNAQSGISPYNLIDVEQVVATIQLLANRYNSEVMPLSPFINGWDRIIDEIDRLPLPDYRQITDSILPIGPSWVGFTRL